MYLEKLYLFNFKNHREVQFDFNPKANCILGLNGAGKTNVLDAIYYLSFTKSALNFVDAVNVQHGAGRFAIKGTFVTPLASHEVMCTYTEDTKKQLWINNREETRFADHIGKYPVVLVMPNHTELIWGGSRLRRIFFDKLIAQIDKQYLENLMIYSNQLKQRNNLLRQSFQRSIDHDLLNIYDQKMASTGCYICDKRVLFIKKFIPLFTHYYSYMTGNALECPGIIYRSDSEGKDLYLQLQQSLERDRVLQRTGVGVHRDDFLFLLNDYPVKQVASHGQQKSFLIALKLAEFEIIGQHKGFKPLLLLDDIFDKLDDERIDKLLTIMAQSKLGQFFITDARSGRVRKWMDQKKIKPTFFSME